MKYFVIMIFAVFALLIIQNATIFADNTAKETEMAYKQAGTYFVKGQYKEAITLYDKILKDHPNHPTVLKMKAIAESNLGLHQKSMSTFFKAYQQNRQDSTAAIGIGVGFGNLGEYAEAKKHFDQTVQMYPNYTLAKNYKDYTDKIIKKYPYKPTEKPKNWNDKVDQKTFESYVTKVKIGRAHV